MKNTASNYGQKLDFKSGRIDLTHGSGGLAMAQLIDELFIPNFNNEFLNQKNDQACLTVGDERIVISTDAHVVSPIFFAGGDIGSLAVHGTINDVAMAGAMPMCLSAACIIEEGFPLADLQKIVHSMAMAAKEAGVPIVTGDTKVVEAGKADKIFITTTGMGIVKRGVHISGNLAKPGDKILVNGFIGDHGVAIMSQRNGLSFSTHIKSDSAPLHTLVQDILDVELNIHCLRDPTRGGLATTLNEIARQSSVGMHLFEDKIPVKNEVKAACEILGLDPLYVANEGKMIIICPSNSAEKVLAKMQAHTLGKNAAIIGEVIEDENCFVQMTTSFGGKRIVQWLTGEQLPRIC